VVVGLCLLDDCEACDEAADDVMEGTGDGTDTMVLCLKS